MLLRSRIVLPMTAPPVEDGAVLVSGDRIEAVGRWADLRDSSPGPVVDLGETVLLPGLINAHCHLDYTHLACHLAPPRRFTDWLQGMLGLKAGWSFSEYAGSWLAGAGQSVRSGCTSVMDFEAVPELLPEVWHGTPLRVISALELTGVRSGRRAEDILDEALSRIDRLTPSPGKSMALAPHAPYSTRAELIRLTAQAAKERRLPIACHVAESIDEYEMFVASSGPMHQWLRSQREMSDCGRGTPLRHVAEQGMLGERTLLVHLNYLGEGDVECVAASGAAVVHCPRSHEYFGHAPFEYRRLREAGIRVGLGTDSLVSVRRCGAGIPVLSLFDEMQAFLRHHPTATPAEVLTMVTRTGAWLLGREGELGEVRSGCLADLIVVPYSGSTEGVESGVVRHRGDVPGVMIDGKWVVVPPGAQAGGRE